MAGIGGMLAAGAVKAALGKVASAAGDRVMLQWRFSKDLEYMKDTMESIEAVMEDAERRSIEDKSVQLWLDRLTRASYDISDTFDEFEVNTTRQSGIRKLKVLNPCLTLASKIRMASKIKEVRENLDKISNERQKYSFTTSSSPNDQQVINERETTADVIEEKIVGRDQEKQKMMDLLRSSSPSSEFIILPIYGIGGIGKTTLAQLVFNDTQFNDYKKAWVYVSQTFDLNKIKETVRSQLQLNQGQLANTQEQDAGPSAPKSVLIVLDDLWERDDFKLDDMKESLKKIVGNGQKVHVIVTTRDAGIAEKIQTIEAHNIEALSVDVCWTIIKSKIVGFEDRSDKETLRGIGKEIAKKCGGVALAARAIGYILRSKRDSHGWVSVRDNGIWNVSSSGSSPYHNVFASLKLSYTSMPPDLRLCFAYCAVFPKGHNMAKDELIYQWAALGFIKPSDEFPTWQQHGESCIKQLLDMSFFQLSKSSSSDGQQHGKGGTLFTMHDLVHDLARSVMGPELFYASKQSDARRRNFRYALLPDYSEPLNSFVTHHDKIRVLRFHGSGETDNCSAGFSTAKYLRVLDLSEGSLEKLPSSIGQLKLLRYLNAPGIKHKMIPKCITKLSKLIYLSLRGSSSVLALPESIGEMESLMYLDLSCCSGITKLPESFGKLKNLIHLDLSGCQLLEELPESFKKLGNLIHLDLSGCIWISGISEALCSLTKLQYLNLSNHGQGWEKKSLGGLSKVIGQLNELRYLNLSGCMGPEGTMEMEDLDDIFDGTNTLPNLEHLDLSSNRCLHAIPDSIRSHRKLHTLDLTGCRDLNERGLPMNKSLITLPNFVVHAAKGEQSSNLVLLKDVNPPELKISSLENVKSIEEARRIDLSEKQNMEELTLDWTRGAKGSVKDTELLRELRPPSSLRKFEVQGYNSVSFPPSWLISTDIYLPNLVNIELKGLSQCACLPPLGQLPNLEELHLAEMPSLTKIDRGFCGHGTKAFAKLVSLTLSNMENLEEWITTYSYGEGVTEDEFMFPDLQYLDIRWCPKLRVGPCPPRVTVAWSVRDSSDGVLVQWGESVPHHTGGFSPRLYVSKCMTPMHQWKLLHHLPGLDELTIDGCSSDLSSSPEITTQALISELPQWVGGLTSLQSLELSRCPNIQALPEWLGDCVSLKKLTIKYCEGITSFPESIQQLTNLESLTVKSCPELREWCNMKENKTKIGHIEKIVFDYCDI